MKLICDCIFVPKKGVAIFMYYNIGWTLKTIEYFGEYLCAFMQIFMPYWNFECTKALTLHCG